MKINFRLISDYYDFPLNFIIDLLKKGDKLLNFYKILINFLG